MDEYLALWQEMYRLRAVAESLESVFAQGLLPGGMHLAIGQEAVNVGVVAGLDNADWILPTYRGVPYLVARGVPLEGLLRELVGSAGGINQGRHGAKHVGSLEHRVGPGNAIVGGYVATGVGLAFAAARQNTGGAVLAAIGDGAMNQGVVYEALNLASTMSVPFILLCENNGYGEMTPLRESTAGDLCARAASFGAGARRCDGNDVLEVRDTIAAARAQAIEQQRPVFVDAITYRQCGHMIGDPGGYRDEQEILRWTAKDPIDLLERLIVLTGGEDSVAELRRLREKIAYQIQSTWDLALDRAQSVDGGVDA